MYFVGVCLPVFALQIYCCVAVLLYDFLRALSYESVFVVLSLFLHSDFLVVLFSLGFVPLLFYAFVSSVFRTLIFASARTTVPLVRDQIDYIFWCFVPCGLLFGNLCFDCNMIPSFCVPPFLCCLSF